MDGLVSRRSWGTASTGNVTTAIRHFFQILRVIYELCREIKLSSTCSPSSGHLSAAQRFPPASCKEKPRGWRTRMLCTMYSCLAGTTLLRTTRLLTCWVLVSSQPPCRIQLKTSQHSSLLAKQRKWEELIKHWSLGHVECVRTQTADVCQFNTAARLPLLSSPWALYHPAAPTPRRAMGQPGSLILDHFLYDIPDLRRLPATLSIWTSQLHHLNGAFTCERNAERSEEQQGELMVMETIAGLIRP